MPYRFVHTADIHLDSPLRSLALRDPELADLIGNATRRAFENIIDLCLFEQVDALLLAGDLYDGDQTSMKTARFLSEQLRRLHQADIRTFIIRGNHDALSKITKELTLPDSVQIFRGRAEAIPLVSRVGGISIAMHGMSFTQPHAPESLLPKYRPPVEGAVNIGLMHTSLGGVPPHDTYAPCSLADLRDSSFAYWALGHIHKSSIERGRSVVVMPGMPQGRDINEAGAKSASLVTVADDRSIEVEERVTAVAQFERVSIDVTGITEWAVMARTLGAKLEQKRMQVRAEHLVARLHITGVTPLAWRLRRDADLVKAEADDRGFALGRSWIEKVEIDCRAPEALSSVAAPGPLTELRGLINDDVLRSDAFRTELAGIADELRAQLPHECRAFLGADAQAFEAIMVTLARDGAEDVLARLHARSGQEPA